MNSRKRAVVYIKAGLCDDLDSLLKDVEGFCKRRRIILVDAITVEASDAQPKLTKLLSDTKSKDHADLIVSPSFTHFSSPPKMITHLAELLTAGIGVAFAKESLVFYPNAANTKTLCQFAERFVAAGRFSKSQHIKQSLKVASLFGRKLGRQRLPENVRLEAEQHLRAGRSLRDTAKIMNGKISKSSLWTLRQELKKRSGS